MTAHMGSVPMHAHGRAHVSVARRSKLRINCAGLLASAVASSFELATDAFRRMHTMSMDEWKLDIATAGRSGEAGRQRTIVGS